MKSVPLWKIFLVFAKLGAVTIGGGYVMIPAIENEMRKHRWIDEEELPDIVALSQSAPGLLTVNMAIFAGNRLRGVPGSIVATLGSIIAPFFVILGIAAFFRNFSDNPVIIKILMGVRPAAVALIAGYFLKLLRKNSQTWQLCMTSAVLLLMIFLKISAIYIILVTIIAAFAYARFKERRKKQ